MSRKLRRYIDKKNPHQFSDMLRQNVKEGLVHKVRVKIVLWCKTIAFLSIFNEC